jgi:glycolate oxidase
LLDEHQLEHIVFGHAGDGNYHIHVFFDDNRMVWENIQVHFDEIITAHEGFISGEHGIGRIHSERYRSKVSDWNKNIYTALKSCLDPNNQLPSLI